MLLYSANLSWGQSIFCKIEKNDLGWKLVGHLTEALDLRAFDDLTYPFILNLKEISSVNSIGIRSFRNFAASWGLQSVELHECSIAIVDAINTFPGLLGEPANARRVKSIFLPFSCPECFRDYTEKFAAASPKDWKPSLIKPPKCGSCDIYTELDGEYEDYFTFLECHS